MTLMPMIIVACTGILALIVEMARPKKSNEWVVATSIVGLALAGLALFKQLGMEPLQTAGEMVVLDGFATTMQIVLVLGTLLTVIFSDSYLRAKRIAFGEFYPLLLWSTTGAMMMASTKNLLMIFLGLEVLSVSLYVMAGMSRQEEKSEESALKYFLLGAFASGFLLYGIAFVYGATGSLHLDSIPLALLKGDPTTVGLLVFGLGLMLVGLCFKASFAPFHQWTPDVYQGAPTNVTSFMATGSKVGAFAALWRVLEAYQIASNYWMPVLTVVAVITMFWGNLVALRQNDVKRVLGYSSIAHAGYILVAIMSHAADPQHVSYTTVTYYLLSYMFMTIGAFAIVSLAAKNGKEGTRFEDLNGLWKRSPLAAGALIVFVASLIGIPPTSGFFGKYFIFADALKSHQTLLAVVLAINSIISIAYYLKLGLAAVVNDEEVPSTAPVKANGGVMATSILCMIGVLGIAFFYAPLMNQLDPPPMNGSGVVTSAAR